MADMLYLFDSNILIRWVQPVAPDYPIVEAALNTLVKSGTVLCYTSQNLDKFWNASTRPVSRNRSADGQLRIGPHRRPL
jgi:hypothetical protein